MKKHTAIVIVLVLVAGLCIAIGLRRRSDSQTVRIAVIPKGATHNFWMSIRKGAEKAAGEVGAEIVWSPPEHEGDRERQIQILEDLLMEKVSGIVLAPNDDNALVPVVERIYDQKIPCIIIDSDIQTPKRHSFVATDNYEGGVIAARHLGETLDGRGDVIVIRYAQGSASTEKRENGFLQTMEKEFPQIRVVDTKYGMETVDTAIQATEDLLTKNPDVDGLYACNETTSHGALKVLQDKGLAGQVKMVGFDFNEVLQDGLEKGHISGLVVQNPFRMGYEGVKTVMAVRENQSVPEYINTGVRLVTRENLSDPDIQAVLFPK
ncbi:MAG: substrate-binding domain-containing protein [Sedimentisphaerales bacterium]|nr:substrate-binding domain-containing protein [Sedimentisphaerales bacterium]